MLSLQLILHSRHWSISLVMEGSFCVIRSQLILKGIGLQKCSFSSTFKNTLNSSIHGSSFCANRPDRFFYGFIILFTCRFFISSGNFFAWPGDISAPFPSLINYYRRGINFAFRLQRRYVSTYHAQQRESHAGLPSLPVSDSRVAELVGSIHHIHAAGSVYSNICTELVIIPCGSHLWISWLRKGSLTPLICPRSPNQILLVTILPIVCANISSAGFNDRIHGQPRCAVRKFLPTGTANYCVDLVGTFLKSLHVSFILIWVLCCLVSVCN